MLLEPVLDHLEDALGPDLLALLLQRLGQAHPRLGGALVAPAGF